MSQSFPTDGLKTDLYELTMAAGYFQQKVNLTATFELFCHKMPAHRSYLIACGLEQVLDYILNLRFSNEDIKFLKTLPVFKHVEASFFDYLKRFRFTGEVWAVPEGEIVFAHEPIIQVRAPIIEAQILETYLLSIVNIETLVAAKARRVVAAASSDGVKRGVVDFGFRRAHGPQAGILGARASYIAGCMGTSNTYAGREFHIPVFGTMAHSWVESHDDELESFRKFSEVFPDHTILLIDTYDTLRAARLLVKLKRKMDVKAVRIDSGDLNSLSRKVRAILNAAGLMNVKILASGNLNEFKIAELVNKRAPIDMFGVGTEMIVSQDAPSLDLTYKLVEVEDAKNNISYKAKSSQGKATIPGRKQVFRQYAKDGRLEKDVLGKFRETTLRKTTPLLRPVVKNGELILPLPAIEQIRKTVEVNVAKLPKSFLTLQGAARNKLEFSPTLLKLKKEFEQGISH